MEKKLNILLTTGFLAFNIIVVIVTFLFLEKNLCAYVATGELGFGRVAITLIQALILSYGVLRVVFWVIKYITLTTTFIME